MKVLLFCLKGFETMEFSPFIDVLGWARNDFHYEINVETCGFYKEVNSTFNVLINVNKTISEINIDDYDAIAIPGGFEEFGFYEEAYDERFSDLIRKFNERKKIIASVCVGALPVAKSGILKNRKATTYHLNEGYRQKQLLSFGVNVINEEVVVDDNVITSYCPSTAVKVAFVLLEKLIGKDASKVKYAMGY